MNSIFLFIYGLTVACLVTNCKKSDEDPIREPYEDQLDELRAAVINFADIENAIAFGYDNEFTGYRSQMGYHYLNVSLLDDKFEVEKPEVLMYAPDDHGNLKFVGVEYAVPIEDMSNPPPAPEGFIGNVDVWEINHEFNVWTLHVWVGMDNPHGIFASHNPNLP